MSRPMSKKPLVSVVVPTFNRSGLLCRAVESALRQTYANMEVVVVDDGSTDDTPAVVKDRYGTDSRVKYLRVNNGGVSRARNIGIANSTGDFVGFLDSDDYWLPWKTELQLQCLQRVPGAGMIWTDMNAVDDTGTVIHERYLRKMYTVHDELVAEGIPLFSDAHSLTARELGIQDLSAEFTLSHGEIFSQMIVGSVVHTSTTLLRRERLNKVRGFREDLKISGEDYDFHLRTCREGVVAFVDIPTIGYTVGRSDQLTASAMSVHIAKNSLRTLEPILAESRHLVRLPPGKVERVLAGKHAWVAKELLDLDRRREARGHVLESLHYQPLALRRYALLGASLVPSAFLNVLLALRRRVRAIFSRAKLLTRS
jgi:GT2 family glycosyltransferase